MLVYNPSRLWYWYIIVYGLNIMDWIYQTNPSLHIRVKKPSPSLPTKTWCDLLTKKLSHKKAVVWACTATYSK